MDTISSAISIWRKKPGSPCNPFGAKSVAKQRADAIRAEFAERSAVDGQDAKRWLWQHFEELYQHAINKDEPLEAVQAFETAMSLAEI